MLQYIGTQECTLNLKLWQLILIILDSRFGFDRSSTSSIRTLWWQWINRQYTQSQSLKIFTMLIEVQFLTFLLPTICPSMSWFTNEWPTELIGLICSTGTTQLKGLLVYTEMTVNLHPGMCQSYYNLSLKSWFNFIRMKICWDSI